MEDKALLKIYVFTVAALLILTVIYKCSVSEKQGSDTIFRVGNYMEVYHADSIP